MLRKVPVFCTCSAALTLKVFLLCLNNFLEDTPQGNGVQTNQYSAISPPGSPVDQEEAFSTYFEEKVPIPENASEVGNSSHIFVKVSSYLILVKFGRRRNKNFRPS